MRAAGPRSCRSRLLPGRVLQGKIPRGEDRLRGPDAEWTGEACRGGQRPARWRADRDGREAEGSRAREPGAAAGRRDPAQGRDPRAVASGCAIGPSPAGGGPGTMVARVSCGGGARPPVEDMIAFVCCPAGHGGSNVPGGNEHHGASPVVAPSVRAPPATGRADLQGAADRPLRRHDRPGCGPIRRACPIVPGAMSDRSPGSGAASDAGFRVHGVREICRHPPGIIASRCPAGQGTAPGLEVAREICTALMSGCSARDRHDAVSEERAWRDDREGTTARRSRRAWRWRQ